MVKQMMDQFQDKKYKAEYLQLQQQYITDLKLMSQELKGIVPTKRSDHLMVELTKLNHWIESHIQSVVQSSPIESWKLSDSPTSQRKSLKHSGIKGPYRFNYHGLMLPFDGGDDEDPHIMVKIVPELNQAFNTKERAPFKIVCETIKYKELQDQEKRSKKQDILFNKSPRQDSRGASSVKSIEGNSLPSGSIEEDQVPDNEDPDAWEKVSYGDLNLEGMNDPFQNKFKGIINE